MKIYLDAGHGGADPGAIGHGIEEKDIALAVSLKVVDHLRRHEFEVKLSRSTDVGKSLQARTNEANAWGADAFVSIHCNAAASPTAEGFEVWHTIHASRSKGDELARAIVSWLDQLTPLTNRGARSKAGSSGQDYYHVIRETKMPAVIVECGFVSNQKDAAYLKSPEGKAAIAEAIARGIVEWAGMTWRSAGASQKHEDGKKYRLLTGTFATREDAEAAAKKLRQQFSWTVYVIASGDRYRLKTGTFSSRQQAEEGAEKLRQMFGWTVYVQEEK